MKSKTEKTLSLPFVNLTNFAIYFSSSSPFLKSLSSTLFICSCLLTSTFSLPLNLVTISFVFSKFTFFFQISCFAVKPFYLTKYFTLPHIILLLRIFSTFLFSSLSISIGFSSSTFCLFISLLYLTTLLTFTTGWILIKAGNLSLTTLVNTTS